MPNRHGLLALGTNVDHPMIPVEGSPVTLCLGEHESETISDDGACALSDGKIAPEDRIHYGFKIDAA